MPVPDLRIRIERLLQVDALGPAALDDHAWRLQLTSIKARLRVATTLSIRFVKQRELAMYQRILVPIDGSPTSNKGLDEAVQLARLTGAMLRLIDNLGARVSNTVIEHAKAWGADLIVVGTHGRRGITRWMLGSDAEQMVRMARVPVLLVRAPEAPDDSPATPFA